MKILLGQKIGMTQIWDDKGRLVAATVIFAEPNKTITEGQRTLLVAKTAGSTSKPQKYLAKQIDSTKGIRVKEIKNSASDEPLTVAQFNAGEIVRIAGTTKGKGFAGTIKRHNFHRGPVSHGSDNVRGPGSIGAQRPQRVPKGQKMGGHMGSDNFTVRGIKVLAVKPEDNLLVVKGAVPGPNKGSVIVMEQTNE